MRDQMETQGAGEDESLDQPNQPARTMPPLRYFQVTVLAVSGGDPYIQLTLAAHRVSCEGGVLAFITYGEAKPLFRAFKAWEMVTEVTIEQLQAEAKDAELAKLRIN